MKEGRLILLAMVAMACTTAWAGDELISYGDFEKWVTRTVKESVLVGGKTVTMYEVGPTQTWAQNKAYTNQGGSPWATSNVYAKVAGVVKSNVSVYPDTHGDGKCVKLTTHEVRCKAVGIVNITVLAAGSLFTGEAVEPITSSSNPMSKISAGIAFTKRPTALKFDYKIQLSESETRIRQTGFSRRKEIPGKDYCEALVLLQKRWEDSEGNIHATRVGTMWKRFTADSDWVDGASFEIHYGDISGTSYYKSYMELQNETSERVYYAKNSKGKMAMITEEGWADENETPTHIVIIFNSSHGGAYIGSIGNTMWIDNVKLVY
ncbi:MAG: PCMD domain-containing protein [Prevotellaceae bacterium]|nr:PCMD domain-containing protein [Prevotellaceae bacterium]